MTHLDVAHSWVFFLLIPILAIVLWAGLRTYASMGRTRKVLIALARVLVVVGVIVGLASVRWWRSKPEEKLCVIACVDISESIPDGALDDAVAQIDELFSKADDTHAVGLILFASDARVAIAPITSPPAEGEMHEAIRTARAAAASSPLPPGEGRERGSTEDLPSETSPAGQAGRGTSGSEMTGFDRSSTNVERALDLAMGVFPEGFGRRIVLFCDGNATDGDAISKAHRCLASGIDVQTVTLSHEQAPFDLAVTSVALPTRVQPGVGFDVKVNLSARASGEAMLSLYRNGYLLEERELDLDAGPQSQTFRQRLDDPGLYLYRARLSCRRKQATLGNDAAFAFTRLRTQPKVLILGETDLESRHLLSALRGGRIVCEFRTADGAPEQMADLLDFDAVILNNLRASSLNAPRQRLLRDWVDLFGGALLVVGLDPVGGYADTPVEEALPVVCNLDRLPKTSVSTVVIADTSRSLILADRQDAVSASDETLSRPAIIRRTAKQILSGLSERDTFGVIGYGSEQFAPRWIVRPQKVYDRARIEQSIDDHLQTHPRFLEPQALDDVIDKLADPAEPMPAEELARQIEKLTDPDHRPHVVPGKLMPFLRNRLKVRAQAINPEQLCQAVERVLEPNAFLARSNAYRSVVRAVSELKSRETSRKSIIMLTDGYLEGGIDYPRIAGQLAADGISVSTIALKERDANKPLLQAIARWGVGRNWSLDDPAAFAETFREQMASVEKPRVMEFPFRARKVADSPLLRGVNVAVAPQLFGYVRTSPKLGARNVLAVPPDYEPLLASWDYGAGRAAVFTSDAQERWASLWIRDWPQGYDRLWTSVMSALCERPAGRRLVPQLDVNGQDVTLTVDFVDESNRFLNGETLRARFYDLGEEGYVFSRTSVEEVPMTQVAPGKYSCEYRAPRKGIYVARVAGEGPRDVAATAFVVSLLAEETALTADEAELNRWAVAGGGTLGGTPDDWLDRSTRTRESAVNLSQWAMILAAFIFVIDVILRRWEAFVGRLEAQKGRRNG